MEEQMETKHLMSSTYTSPRSLTQYLTVRWKTVRWQCKIRQETIKQLRAGRLLRCSSRSSTRDGITRWQLSQMAHVPRQAKGLVSFKD